MVIGRCEMKIKTQDLIGEALDLAVAECVGLNLYVARLQRFSPSTNWAQGGPIIEREKIDVSFISSEYAARGEGWEAYCMTPDWELQYNAVGPTPLIAAMRAYVMARLGEELDIPEELV